MSQNQTTACPECGEADYQHGEWREGNYEHVCTLCGQSWFPDVDYSKPAPNQTTELRPEDFARYDMELMAGRRAYLAGLPITVNPHPRDTDAWAWWREGYDQ
jgi:Zn ribbon nucleic-acid-binding protein